MADFVEVCPFTSRKRAATAAERLEAFAVEAQLQDERAPMVAADVVGHRPRVWAVEADYVNNGGDWRPCGPRERDRNDTGDGEGDGEWQRRGKRHLIPSNDHSKGQPLFRLAVLFCSISHA